MNLILTMAGKYSRFREEGMKIPKYLLPWGNRSILSEIIYKLTESNDIDNVFLIANKNDDDYLGHVRSIMNHYNITHKNLVLLDDTTGQAETAFLGLQAIEKFHKLQGPIVFHNIDTILYERDMGSIKKSLKSYDGHIDVFNSNNHDYSYVLVKNSLVEVISEKVLISNLATSGLYGFANADLFINNYDNEGYISEIYKKIIGKNYKITIGKTYNEKETIVLGTPAEYLTKSALYLYL